jgi:hypothetical protein
MQLRCIQKYTRSETLCERAVATAELTISWLASTTVQHSSFPVVLSMDFNGLQSLRLAIIELHKATSRHGGGFGLAVNDALYHSRAMPAEAVRAIVAGGEKVQEICRAFSALAPAGRAFRAHAATVLPDLVRPVAAAVKSPRTAAAGRRARADLLCVATLMDEWNYSHGDEKAVALSVHQMREEHTCLAVELDRLLRIRDEDEREAVAEAARIVDSQPPSIPALENSAHLQTERTKALLDEVKTVFSVLGKKGLNELSTGGSDGVRDALRDIWARLTVVESEGGKLLTQLRLRLRLETLSNENDRRQSARCGELLKAVRAALDCISNERSYCEAAGVRTMRAASFFVVNTKPNNATVANEGSGDEEWDKPVVVRNESDSEKEELANASLENLDLALVALLPLSTPRPGPKVAELSRKELVAIVSSRAAGAAHNASTMAFVKDFTRGRSATGRATSGPTGSRKRLKAQLGKKKTRPRLTLSP